MMYAKICHRRPNNPIMLIDREEDLEITLSADFDERSNTSFYTADNEKRHLKAPEELVSGLP